MDRKDEILRSVSDLKPLSASATRLMSIVSDPDHSIAEIVGVVENDVMLTGNVLRMVNSAAFALAVQINTVARAVSYIGGNIIAGMAMGLCASHIFHDALEGYNSGPGQLWRHSLRTAIASREIARAAQKGVNPQVAYTAGILHDIGKGVISAYLQGHVDQMVLAAEADDNPNFLDSEKAVSGTDHCEVGEALARHWNLPESLCQAIAHHHEPARAGLKHMPLVYAVHLADHVVMRDGTGTGADTMLYTLDTAFAEHSPVTGSQLEGIIKDSEKELDKAAESLLTEK